MFQEDTVATAIDPTELTIADAAARMAVDPKTIRRWISDGTLPARRVGKRLIRIRPADLDGLGTPLGNAAR